MNDFEIAVWDTPTYKEIRSRSIRHLGELTYEIYRDRILDEAFGKFPDDKKTFMGCYEWFTPRIDAIKSVMASDGFVIHWKSEFELMFKKWMKTQEPGPKTPIANLDWYQKKRNEFYTIYMNQVEEWKNEDFQPHTG